MEVAEHAVRLAGGVRHHFSKTVRQLFPNDVEARSGNEWLPLLLIRSGRRRT
jgi:hypothetical protein